MKGFTNLREEKGRCDSLRYLPCQFMKTTALSTQQIETTQRYQSYKNGEACNNSDVAWILHSSDLVPVRFVFLFLCLFSPLFFITLRCFCMFLYALTISQPCHHDGSGGLLKAFESATEISRSSIVRPKGSIR